MKNLVFIILLIALACSSKNPGGENVSLSPADFKAKLAATPDAVLLDVRTQEEANESRIRKNQLNFDFNSPEFKILIKGMDKTNPYFVYCAAGKRSAKAANMMSDLGFTKLYLLD